MNPRGGTFAGATACPSASGDDPMRPLINHGSTMHGGHSLGIDECAIVENVDAMVGVKVVLAVAFIDIVVFVVGGLGGSLPPADGQAAAPANVTPRGFICIDGNGDDDGDGDGHDDGGRMGTTRAAMAGTKGRIARLRLRGTRNANDVIRAENTKQVRRAPL
uniref:Uncharacterized protein n=1 Tax=Oryza barthii TaxID=65489 RepID=A0A0D3FIE1_9ORYZ